MISIRYDIKPFVSTIRANIAIKAGVIMRTFARHRCQLKIKQTINDSVKDPRTSTYAEPGRIR